MIETGLGAQTLFLKLWLRRGPPGFRGLSPDGEMADEDESFQEMTVQGSGKRSEESFVTVTTAEERPAVHFNTGQPYAPLPQSDPVEMYAMHQQQQQQPPPPTLAAFTPAAAPYTPTPAPFTPTAAPYTPTPAPNAPTPEKMCRMCHEPEDKNNCTGDNQVIAVKVLVLLIAQRGLGLGDRTVHVCGGEHVGPPPLSESVPLPAE
jgi:hypothetical protein